MNSALGLDLTEIKEIAYLNDFLRSFFIATGLYAEAVTQEGETFYSLDDISRCEFCSIIRGTLGGVRRCKESYKRAAIEAAKWKEPYFFRCHAGLVMWAVPIIIRDNPMGSIICGQVLLWKPDDFFWKEQEHFHSRNKNFDKLIVAVQKLEVVSAERAQAAADLLFIVVNHIVKRNVRTLEDIDRSNKVQQELRQKMERAGKDTGSEARHYETYIKKEQALLSYISLGDRAKAESMFNTIFADLFIITKGRVEEIKQRAFELCCLVSRSAVEGGVDAERAMEILDEYDLKASDVTTVLFQAKKILEYYLDDIFAFTNKKHLGMVKRAREFILDNYSQPIKVEDISAALYISSSHLSRLFRQELNCTVLEYLTRVRIVKAIELLKRNENSVQDVSKMVGFKYSSYFVRVFKQHTGITPLAYRNKLF